MKKIVTLIGLIISFQSYSQMFDDDKVIWIDPGIDFSIALKEKGFDGIGLNVGLNYFKNKTSFKLKYQHLKEISAEGTTPIGHINNFGLMAGRGIELDYHSCLQFSAGIGVIGGTIKGKYLRSETYISGYINHYTISISGGGGSWQDPIYSTREIYEENTFITTSIPLEVTLIIKGEYVGTCVSIFSDLNKVQSIYGLSLKLFLGGYL
jgi:hypothetical protein